MFGWKRLFTWDVLDELSIANVWRHSSVNRERRELGGEREEREELGKRCRG